MNDSFTEITSESWFSRLGGSIKGILFGILLFIAAFPLLWWNEGRSVERYNSLKEGLALVISVSSETVDPSNNNKLVHTQGLATTKELLQDDIFDVSATAIKLIRNVSMYQWQEDKKSTTTEKVGGSKETKTTYSYSKGWHSSEINSSSFKRSGHNNPSMLFSAQTQQAQKVTLGAFQLNSSQIGEIDPETSLSIHDANPPTTLSGKKLTLTGNEFYLGKRPNDPQIGDMKISFRVVNPTDVSLVAQQKSNSFIAYQTKAGSPIDLLKLGLMDANSMFAAAQKENTIMTWGIRIGGTLMMWIGLSMLFKPLAVLASVLPFLGNLISMGTKILAALITLPCAMLTIAFAWIAYRPLLAGGLIAIAVIAIVAMKFMPRKNRVPNSITT
jgi:hypothetical protein